MKKMCVLLLKETFDKKDVPAGVVSCGFGFGDVK